MRSVIETMAVYRRMKECNSSGVQLDLLSTIPMSPAGFDIHYYIIIYNFHLVSNIYVHTEEQAVSKEAM